MHRLGTAWGLVALARIRWLIQRGCSQGCLSTLFSKKAEPAIEEHLSDSYKSPHRNVHDTLVELIKTLKANGLRQVLLHTHVPHVLCHHYMSFILFKGCHQLAGFSYKQHSW